VFDSRLRIKKFSFGSWGLLPASLKGWAGFCFYSYFYAMQDIATKISVALQKKYGEAGLEIAFNERNPFNNVISFIIPLDAISKMLVNILKG